MINDETPLLQQSPGGSEQLASLFQPLPAQQEQAHSVLEDDDDKNNNNTAFSPGKQQQQQQQQNLVQTIRLFLCNRRRVSLRHVVSTLIGSFTFLLYHVVFCLAQASAITRPHGGGRVPIIGPMAKMSALGIFLGSTVFVWFLGDDIPAIYPTSDLFLAPFLSNLAITIDRVLYQDGLESNTLLFLSTFTAVSSSALFLSGCLCVLAARVRLANLGAFLPYSVLCGFFTAIGILMWTLAFSVDTGGLQPTQVLLSGNTTLVQQALVHHAPSLAVGITMYLSGPVHPFLVLFLVLGTILASYLLMMLTGTSLTQAQNDGWFWSANDLVLSNNNNATTTLSSSTFLAHWVPPQPFGLYHSIFLGQVYWRAFKSCLPTVLSLAFLYLIRCSLHAAALKKNIPNVTRPKTPDDDDKLTDLENGPPSKKRPPLTLQKTLECGYAYSQLVAALSGGLGVAPAVAASLTLFKLGAEAKAPQFGSFFLIFFFYLTDFRLVQFIPKPAFSCLLVLAFLDMTANWLVMSYRKIRNKAEWAVAPLIVVLTFAVGMLNAIFLGVAFSTFIFVASFYRTGVVKYLANGLTLRSSTERGIRETKWLNQNGDLLQIIVLQNYLFFGNAQSLLSYVSTMFQEPVEERSQEEERTQSVTAPKPLYLVMDCTIVTGMDTSAVDLMREIAALCTANNCSLYLVGLSRDLRRTLEFGGVDASRSLSYQPDLESALSKAEDRLLKHVLHIEELDVQQANSRRRARTLSNVEDGFMYALSRIDEQHGFHYSEKLSPLQEHTKIVELQPGESLFLEDDGVAKERGFFFIEHGLLKVEKDALSTLHRQRDGIRSTYNTSSIGHLNARTAPIGLTSAHAGHSAMFRLARVGQGWVVGTVEGLSGSRHPGIHTAVTPCRLHLLPFHTIPEIEESNPSLVLSLFRLLSHLAARQQELTIEQLAQFVAIGIAPRG